MKKEILFFILTGIDFWKEDEKLGEEVRMLYNNIYNLCINRDEPVLGYIYELIEDNLSNGLYFQYEISKRYTKTIKPFSSNNTKL